MKIMKETLEEKEFTEVTDPLPDSVTDPAEAGAYRDRKRNYDEHDKILNKITKKVRADKDIIPDSKPVIPKDSFTAAIKEAFDSYVGDMDADLFLDDTDILARDDENGYIVVDKMSYNDFEPDKELIIKFIGNGDDTLYKYSMCCDDGEGIKMNYVDTVFDASDIYSDIDDIDFDNSLFEQEDPLVDNRFSLYKSYDDIDDIDYDTDLLSDVYDDEEIDLDEIQKSAKELDSMLKVRPMYSNFDMDEDYGEEDNFDAKHLFTESKKRKKVDHLHELPMGGLHPSEDTSGMSSNSAPAAAVGEELDEAKRINKKTRMSGGVTNIMPSYGHGPIDAGGGGGTEGGMGGGAMGEDLEEDSFNNLKNDILDAISNIVYDFKNTIGQAVDKNDIIKALEYFVENQDDIEFDYEPEDIEEEPFDAEDEFDDNFDIDFEDELKNEDFDADLHFSDRDLIDDDLKGWFVYTLDGTDLGTVIARTEEEAYAKAEQAFPGYGDELEVELEDSLDEDYDENTDCPYINKVAFLANDEVEAIDGYDEAIKLFNDSDVDNKEEIIEKIQHIKEEELEHIEELKLIKSMLSNSDIPETKTATTEQHNFTDEDDDVIMEDDFAFEALVAQKLKENPSAGHVNVKEDYEGLSNEQASDYSDEDVDDLDSLFSAIAEQKME